MLLLNRREFVAASGALAGFAALGTTADAALAHKVYTASPQGAAVDSTLVLGERKAMLIDAQMIVPDAKGVADMVAASGRELETIVITHFHPDHHLGLAVIAERFPGARIVAHPAIAPKINAAAPAILAQRRAQNPAAFADRTIPVTALEGRLALEGETFELVGPLRGDTELITPVWIPQLKAMVAADLVFAGTHVWVAESATADILDGWRRSLDLLMAYQPAVIVPGHRTPDAPYDASGIAHVRRYLDAWQNALAITQTAAALKAAMLERVGSLPGEFMLDRAVAAVRG
jgi:glyoxylase-like metal-dependent hydrolase (beta-lactamase superfamily II)